MPNTLTLSRVLSTYLLFNELQTRDSSIALYVLACASDVLDGFLARRLGSETRIGSMFDACADFLLIFTISVQFYLRGLVSLLFLGLIFVSFMQYLFAKPRSGFDPLGKHIGTVLFFVLGMALVYPIPWFVGWSSLVASSYIVVSLAVKWLRLSSRL